MLFATRKWKFLLLKSELKLAQFQARLNEYKTWKESLDKRSNEATELSMI